MASSPTSVSQIPPPAALPSFITVDTETKAQDVECEQGKDSHNGTSIESKSPSAEYSSNSLTTNEVSATSYAPPSLNETASVENGGNGWMGWLKGTVQSVGTKVAEKAKTSMDNMITTLDPQMKEFINSGGDIDVIVASDKEVKVNPVREAFQKVFGKATVSGFASDCDDVAAQPVGFAAALQAAEGRINKLRASGHIHPQHPVVAVEGFLVELTENMWVEMCVLLLDDPWHDIILQTYSQITPVPDNFVIECSSKTPNDYTFKNTGYAVTIGSVASRQLRCPPALWQENLTGVSRRETILLAARSLAGLYRAKLPTDVI